jgi:hypothetical protein
MNDTMYLMTRTKSETCLNTVGTKLDGPFHLMWIRTSAQYEH